jgi:hypothetical protein
MGMSEGFHYLSIGCLPSVGAFCEDIDHKLLVFVSPLLALWIRVDD